MKKKIGLVCLIICLVVVSVLIKDEIFTKKLDTVTVAENDISNIIISREGALQYQGETYSLNNNRLQLTDVYYAENANKFAVSFYDEKKETTIGYIYSVEDYKIQVVEKNGYHFNADQYFYGIDKNGNIIYTQNFIDEAGNLKIDFYHCTAEYDKCYAFLENIPITAATYYNSEKHRFLAVDTAEQDSVFEYLFDEQKLQITQFTMPNHLLGRVFYYGENGKIFVATGQLKKGVPEGPDNMMEEIEVIYNLADGQPLSFNNLAIWKKIMPFNERLLIINEDQTKIQYAIFKDDKFVIEKEINGSTFSKTGHINDIIKIANEDIYIEMPDKIIKYNFKTDNAETLFEYDV